MEKWLILSYFANMDGNPASHHIDDRLEYFKDHDIDITLLSSFSSKKHTKFNHIRLFSLMPSGLRCEIRKYIKEVLDKKFFFRKLLNLISKIIIRPFGKLGSGDESKPRVVLSLNLLHKYSK